MTRVARAARWIGVLASAAVIGQYVVVAFLTWRYPFQLEWMEGAMLDVAARARMGLPLYVAPSIDYVPYVYPPLYFGVVAISSFVFGLELSVARAVSLFAFAGVCALVFRIAQRETQSRVYALGAVALLVATYALSGRWFHLARVDSLYLLLVAASIYTLRFGTSPRSAAGAGALMWLALLTKQTALLVAIPVLAATALVAPRRAAIAGATFAVASAASWVALGAATDGWFLYYTVALPSEHDLALVDAMTYLGGALIPLLPALTAAIAAIVIMRRRDREAGTFYAGTLVGLALSTCISFAHTGAHLNALMPLCLGVAVLAPIALETLAGRYGARGALVGPLALAAQLALLVHPTAESLPRPGAEASGRRFLAWIGARDGDVLVPDQSFLQTRVGKRSYGLGMAARDVLRAEPNDPGRRLLEESLASAIADRRFSTIVLSQRDWLGGAIALYYEPAGTIDSAPAPVTGWPMRPRYIWVRAGTRQARGR